MSAHQLVWLFTELEHSSSINTRNLSSAFRHDLVLMVMTCLLLLIPAKCSFGGVLDVCHANGVSKAEDQVATYTSRAGIPMSKCASMLEEHTTCWEGITAHVDIMLLFSYICPQAIPSLLLNGLLTTQNQTEARIWTVGILLRRRAGVA